MMDLVFVSNRFLGALCAKRDGGKAVMLKIKIVRALFIVAT